MEKKQGERFVLNGEIYICTEGSSCFDCDLLGNRCWRYIETTGNCVGHYRKDNTDVIFKRV